MTEKEATGILDDTKFGTPIGQVVFRETERIKELQQYRAIGTVEECREAREKQRARKPILDKIYYQQYYCPNCQEMVSRKYKGDHKYNFCHWCGQALDWSEKE